MDARSSSGKHLVALAIGIGFIVAFAEGLLFARALDRPLDLPAFDTLIINTLLLAVPFLALARRRSNRLVPWLAGLALTLGVRWYVLQAGIAYQRGPDVSGVDMGLAFLTTFIAPVVLTVMCLAIDSLLRRNARHTD